MRSPYWAWSAAAIAECEDLVAQADLFGVPVFQAATLTNGTVSLTWSTDAGGIYQLQYNSDSSSTNWSNLGSAVTAAATALSATDSVTNGPRRFYRVVLLASSRAPRRRTRA